MHPHYLSACVSADKTTNNYSTSDISVPQPCTDQVKGARVSVIHAGHAGSVGRHQLVILFIRYLHRCTPPCPARQTTLQIAWLNWLIPMMATTEGEKKKQAWSKNRLKSWVRLKQCVNLSLSASVPPCPPTPPPTLPSNLPFLISSSPPNQASLKHLANLSVEVSTNDCYGGGVGVMTV